jgi:hypothetical protein
MTLVATFACLVLGVVFLSAEEDKPDWQDLVAGAVQEAMEGSGDGEVGQIRRVKMTPRRDGGVDLVVDVRGVDDPDRVAFEVVVFDDNLQPLEPMELTWDEIPTGEGSTTVHLTYQGRAEARSVGGNLLLVDRGTGSLSSRRKVAIPWQWGGSGGREGQPGAAQAPPADSLSVRTDNDGASFREPVVVDLTPVRIGDTPKPEEIRLAGVQTRHAVTKPTPTPRSSRAPAPGPTAKPAQMAVVAPAAATTLKVTSVDLYAMAAKAKWSSSKGTLPFNGSSNDNRGFVRALGTATMLDGKKYPKVLQTHPAWTDNGTISGAYAGTIPSSATRFTAKAGFLEGVTRSDGVRVTVEVSKGNSRTTIVDRTIAAKPGVVTLSGAIPEGLRGQAVVLTLNVHANGTSTQDWFAWIEPVVE